MMEVAPNVSIDEVGQIFLESLSDVTNARDAWVSTDDEGFNLWLLVEPLELDEERALYALIDPLEQHFPGTGFTLHVLNPRTFDGRVPTNIIPAQARHLGARAAH
jgi:hypothetical protein